MREAQELIIGCMVKRALYRSNPGREARSEIQRARQSGGDLLSKIRAIRDLVGAGNLAGPGSPAGLTEAGHIPTEYEMGPRAYLDQTPIGYALQAMGV